MHPWRSEVILEGGEEAKGPEQPRSSIHHTHMPETKRDETTTKLQNNNNNNNNNNNYVHRANVIHIDPTTIIS